jgi:predicted DsbA family dithiol-disulfide isomerase
MTWGGRGVHSVMTSAASSPVRLLDAAPRSLAVEIWSDVVCPWCYIGKRRFEAAVASSGVPVQVTWRSFQLDPTAPVPSVGDAATHLGRKYGVDREQALTMMGQVSEVADGVGLEYHLDRTPYANTADAHRLLHLALEVGAQDELKEALLRAYFTDARDVGDPAVLTDVAVAAGLPADRVAAVLASQEFAQAVQADQAEASALGANGVPFFVIDRRYGVSGAQPSEVFENALRQAWGELAPALVAPAGALDDGDVCGPDGC